MCEEQPTRRKGGMNMAEVMWVFLVAMVMFAIVTTILGAVLVAVISFAAGAAIVGALVARRRWQHRLMPQQRYVPQMQAPPRPLLRPPFTAQQPPSVEQGGQHLSLHFHGQDAVSQAEAVFRQLRGGGR